MPLSTGGFFVHARGPVKASDYFSLPDSLAVFRPFFRPDAAPWEWVRQIAPALEDLSKDLGARVTVAKINIDDNPQTPGKYGVRGIPTLMIFKGGQVTATKVGALPKSKLYEWVESVV